LASLQHALTRHAGVLRSAESLAAAADAVDRAAAAAGPGPRDPADQRRAYELANLAVVARALVFAATERTESRGAHTRIDHPDEDPAFRLRLVVGGPPGR